MTKICVFGAGAIGGYIACSLMKTSVDISVIARGPHKEAIEKINVAAESVGRDIATYGTAHLLFLRIDNSYEEALDAAAEALSVRYAMDFRRPAQKYCALGAPADIAAKIDSFKIAGVRHFVVDFVTEPPLPTPAQKCRSCAAECNPCAAEFSP